MKVCSRIRKSTRQVAFWIGKLLFRSTHRSLFRMEAICQTQSIVEVRFSSVKIKQLRRFGRFYLLRVSTSKRHPKRMQLSLIVGIAFGFWLISDLPISGWSGFPHFRFSLFPGFNISGLRVNLNLTLQSWLNRRFIRGCSSEISIFWSKMRPA